MKGVTAFHHTMGTKAAGTESTGYAVDVRRRFCGCTNKNCSHLEPWQQVIARPLVDTTQATETRAAAYRDYKESLESGERKVVFSLADPDENADYGEECAWWVSEPQGAPKKSAGKTKDCEIPKNREYIEAKWCSMQKRNRDGSMRYDRAAGETVQLPLATCLYLDVDTEVKRRCIEVNAEDAARLDEEAASLL